MKFIILLTKKPESEFELNDFDNFHKKLSYQNLMK